MTSRAVQLVAVGAPLEDRLVELRELEPDEALVCVGAAGVCRSDLHYRSGASQAGPLPLIPGHEIAGTLELAGAAAEPILHERGIVAGTRVSVHYLVSCGHCDYCIAGHEQFCSHGAMIGKQVDGGFADFVIVPARNLVRVPDEVSTEAAAVMMCSTATALHALRKAQVCGGDRVAIFGVGGLGVSAIQLAREMGALTVYAVDINPERLALAAGLGAVPVDAVAGDPAAAIEQHAGGGIDCAIELLGRPESIDAAIRSVGPLGRVAIAGIADEPVSINTYRDVVGRETVISGVSDHTRAEIEYALELSARGRLVFDDVITRTLPLEAAAINDALDNLAAFGPGVRSVVVPNG